MSWSLSASSHTEDEEAERKVMQDLAKVVKEHNESQNTTASFNFTGRYVSAYSIEDALAAQATPKEERPPQL